MSISRGWGPSLLTASWLNRPVMNGPGAWLWNGLQMPGILLQACQNAQLIRCIGRHRNGGNLKKKKPCGWEAKRENLEFSQLDTVLTFVTEWPSAVTKNPSQSALKKNPSPSPPSACLFIGHRLKPIFVVTTTPTQCPDLKPLPRRSPRLLSG